jgi:hypothetical protein
MEGGEVWRVEKVRAGAFGRERTTGKVKMIEDGNLIAGEGIHVGKGRRVVEVPGYAGDVDSRPNANLEVEL